MRKSTTTITIILLLIGVQLAPGEDVSSGTHPVESIGMDLLEDLPAEMPAASDPPASAPPQAAPEMNPKPTRQRPRLDNLGEDRGAPSGPLALIRIQREMQHAEALLSAEAAAERRITVKEATAVQEQIVHRLDELIAELSKQCQGGQCQPGAAPPEPSQIADQRKPGGSGTGGQAAVREANPQLQNGAEVRVEAGEIEALTIKLWGHLPERAREKMLQSFSEEFLPEYEAEIQQYYRRLSEEPSAADGSVQSP